MAHAKPSDLADIDDLLTQIRAIPELKEKSLGCFYLKSKSVAHFHIKEKRRYAHVFDGAKWHEVDIKLAPSSTLQKRIFKSIRGILPIV